MRDRIRSAARQNERQPKVSREEMVVGAKRNAVTLHPVTHNSLARGKAMTPTRDTGMLRVIRGNAVAAVRPTNRHRVRRVCRVDKPRRRLIWDWRQVRLSSHLAMVSLRFCFVLFGLQLSVCLWWLQVPLRDLSDA